MASFYKNVSRIFGSAPSLLAVAGLFFVSSSLIAQERLNGEQRSRFMDRIDPEEGARRLAEFRQQRLQGDYFFEFELEHKPRRSSRKIRYEGFMWGTWNASGPLTRIKIFPNHDSSNASEELEMPVELIVQNGQAPKVWRRDDKGVFVLLEGASVFEPVLEGLLYSPFDLQMPFVYWDSYVYEGPSLIGASRVGQRFLMKPPEGSASESMGITGVRVSLDDTYNSLWRVEIFNGEDSIQSRFAVNGFQKLQDQYIVKRITLTNYPSKDSTTFEVEGAVLNLTLADELFDPNGTVSIENYIPLSVKKL